MAESIGVRFATTTMIWTITTEEVEEEEEEDPAAGGRSDIAKITTGALDPALIESRHPCAASISSLFNLAAYICLSHCSSVAI